MDPKTKPNSLVTQESWAIYKPPLDARPAAPSEDARNAEIRYAEIRKKEPFDSDGLLDQYVKVEFRILSGEEHPTPEQIEYPLKNPDILYCLATINGLCHTLTHIFGPGWDTKDPETDPRWICRKIVKFVLDKERQLHLKEDWDEEEKQMEARKVAAFRKNAFSTFSKVASKMTGYRDALIVRNDGLTELAKDEELRSEGTELVADFLQCAIALTLVEDDLEEIWDEMEKDEEGKGKSKTELWMQPLGSWVSSVFGVFIEFHPECKSENEWFDNDTALKSAEDDVIVALETVTRRIPTLLPWSRNFKRTSEDTRTCTPEEIRKGLRAANRKVADDLSLKLSQISL